MHLPHGDFSFPEEDAVATCRVSPAGPGLPPMSIFSRLFQREDGSPSPQNPPDISPSSSPDAGSPVAGAQPAAPAASPAAPAARPAAPAPSPAAVAANPAAAAA